jgi:Rod binding domain-containing protein
MNLFALTQAVTAKGAGVEPRPGVQTRSAEAAQEFEQIFLRQMLGALMKTTRLGPDSAMPGTDIYDSMVVDALSGSIAKSGGLGLAEIVQRSLDAHSPQTGDRSEAVRGKADRTTEVLAEDSRVPTSSRSLELDARPNPRVGRRRSP